jgi:hypothetical protein
LGFASVFGFDISALQAKAAPLEGEAVGSDVQLGRELINAQPKADRGEPNECGGKSAADDLDRKPLQPPAMVAGTAQAYASPSPTETSCRRILLMKTFILGLMLAVTAVSATVVTTPANAGARHGGVIGANVGH